jgi:Flp pilus assembly secretin CpaC
MTGFRRAHLLAFAACCAIASAASAQGAGKAGVEPSIQGRTARPKATGATATPSDAAVTASLASPVAGRETVAVMIDHAKVVRLPERTQTVIVGNPIIADITAQRNGIVVVTGKSYGVTNLIALDGGGNMLAESLVSVQAATESVVIVQRGLERESYSCTPNCQPSILLGDATKYFSEIGGQAGQRNTLATQR